MPEKTQKQPTFEEAIERLEALIETMEDGEIPLGELVDRFEEGTKLLKSCQTQLRDAELKIEKLNAEDDALEPFGDAPEGDD